MEQLGIDFNATGSVMSKEQLEDQRRKRGECLTCGRKCFQKKLFKMIPITDHGKVLNGRCLNCKPLEADNKATVLPAVSRPATQQDLEAFTRSQSSLRMMNGPGVRPMHSGGDSTRSAPATSKGAPSKKPTPSAKKALDQRAMSYRMPPPVKPEVSTRSVDTAPFLSSPAAALASASSIDEDENSVMSEEEESHNMHSTLLGAMAAKRLANDFKQRKAGQKTTGEEDDDTHEASSCQNGLSSAHSTHSRCSHRSDTANGDKSSQMEGSTSEHSPEEDLVPPKKHGMLNRGGAITFDSSGHISFGGDLSKANGSANEDPRPPITSMTAESSRTISSMSSLGSGDFHLSGGHQLSWKPAAIVASKGTPGAVYEDDEISEASSVGSPIQDASTSRAHSSHRSQPPSVASLKSASGMSVGSNRSSSRNVLVEQEEQRILGLIRENETEYSETVRYIKENPSSALILEEALNSISRLVLAEDDYRAMPSLGVFDAIITAMRCHPHASEIQMAGCGAMWNLSATAENQVALVSAGALDTIFTAMIGFPDDAALQEKAMAALSNIAAAEANQDALLEKDVLTKVVEAMNGHTDETSVQVKGCAVITNMASYDTPAKEAIMESGAGGVVVVSMVMHPDNVELQERALRALRNICANNDLNKIAVANVGGIDSTVSAMQIHRDEAGVQEAGAWTLSNLSVNPDNRAVIGDSGGIDVIVRAMWVHIQSIGVQEWCCRALWSLTIDSHNRTIVLQVGGITAVVNSMQAHTDNPTIQEKCCGILSNLASGSDEKVKMQIVDEEALDAIILAMVLHSDNQNVQDRACSVLRRIAVPSNVKQMQAANVGELVRIAREKFPDKCGDKANQILSVL